MATVDFRTMLPLFGKWEPDSAGNTSTFRSTDTPDASHGLVLLPTKMDDGVLECDIQLPQADQHSGAFIIFRAVGQSMYYAAGLGGWDGAYTICEGRHLTLSRLASLRRSHISLALKARL